MIWLYYTLLAVVLIFGLAITIFTLPGLWVMLAGLTLYAWLTKFAIVGWRGLTAICLICLAAEVVEFFLGGMGAKKAGGSRRAALGAIIGGILGGIFLTFVPIPIISTIIGICAGSFLGAMIMQLWKQGDVNQSIRVGVGAAQGRFLGIISKLIFGVIVLVTCLVLAFP